MELLDKNIQSDLYRTTLELISTFGFSSYSTTIITTLVLSIALVIILYVIDFLFRKVLLLVLTNVIRKSKTKIDDLLVKNKVLQFVTHIVPIIVAQEAIPLIFKGFPNWIKIAMQITDVALVVAIGLLFSAVFKTFRDFLRSKKSFADKPIDSYLQVMNISLFFVCGILIFSIVTGKSPLTFLVSLGAASAILMLVFKDSILGFVASIQVSMNDMVRVGDWIEMTKYGADGTVIEINLGSVKVQNFDKTITTIPTYALVSDSFRNYRGMQNAGGRRIKRSINIKMNSIRFVTEEEIEELKKIKMLYDFIVDRSSEIEQYNRSNKVDPTVWANGRRMTNIGLFRQYIKTYTYNSPKIRKDLMFEVRQLQPTEHGLPIELFMFTNTTVWNEYEVIMADIFDHIIAVVPFFHLEIFESPSSNDMREIAEALKES
ncbi:mechanosensitive ion channel [Empedobacter brevis]|uniref:Mechanosensing system component YbdG n=1 Tax=Empedobacter brevis TaxID=247 RepID=A0AAJ1QFW2_9FLAO|nr:mechanosensitive ion channel domain-containing protein [Empedobacter brevis]MDM1073181.1 mechanosensitive ion channel [Empedobacter brevis]QES91822.1 mechanosensitive ion channel [Empedobacter brevis]QHC83586.1 mechanosensitive ion channel protein MscS [Empedobacter brevis]